VRAAGFRRLHRAAFNSLLLPAIVGIRMVNRLLGRTGGDDDRVPAKPLNRLLTALFGAERHAAVRGLLPVGVSLALVAEPDPGSTR
jgi:hypothetical protein